jgi:queuine tRNA-ribosyltransferase
VGRLHTPHGTVETPGFVVVGTNGAVKFVDHQAADAAGMELMFSNTLHLMLHPGTDAIAAGGGLHKFMGRERKPLITDSGGFQIFSFANRGRDAMPGADASTEAYVNAGSLHGADGADGADGTDADQEVSHSHSELKSSRHEASRRKYSGSKEGSDPRVVINEEGARFRSYRDGSLVRLTPELTVRAQKQIGADIIIPLDDLPAAGTGLAELEASVARTHRWEARSLMEHTQDPREQAMYGVIHGGTDRRLRTASVELLSALPFDGFAIGGSLGKDRAEMFSMLRHVMPLLPSHKPNHLLGIGDEESLRTCVSLGVDTFDSSWPTRMGRHGQLLTRAGTLKIGQAKYKGDYGPVDPACDGFVSTNYSRAYLHHLWKSHEPVVHGLCTLHNIKYMADLMAELRGQILRNEI